MSTPTTRGVNDSTADAQITRAATTSVAAAPLADVSLDELSARVTLLSDLAKAVAEQRETHRTELYRRMPRGSKITARDPQDELITLGTVSMSNPQVEAYITDSAAFDAYCRQEYPDKVEPWVEYTDPVAVAALVAEHAPHLLKLHRTVTTTACEEALKRAASEEVPGTARRLPSPSLTVRPSKHARAAVHGLFGASPVLKELEPPQ
jgi:hypothetical protein